LSVGFGDGGAHAAFGYVELKAASYDAKHLNPRALAGGTKKTRSGAPGLF
jgi:hypothetical protein